jgi:hypothetical protein
MSKVDANVCYGYMEVGGLTVRPEGFSFVSELPLLAIRSICSEYSTPLDLAMIGPIMHELGKWRTMQPLAEGFGPA